MIFWYAILNLAIENHENLFLLENVTYINLAEDLVSWCELVI